MEQLFYFADNVSRDALQLIINGVWIGVLLTSMTALALRYLLKTDAATRYVIHWGLLIVLVVCPLLTGLPRLSALADLNSSTQTVAEESAGDSDALTLPTLESDKSSHAGPLNVLDLYPAETTAPDSSFFDNAYGVVARHQHDRSREEASSPSLAGILLGTAPILFLLVVSGGAVFMLSRLGYSLYRLFQMKLGAYPLGDETAQRVISLLERIDIDRPIRVLRSDQISTPVAIGYRHPVILLPADLGDNLFGDELDTVVLHELAHLARRDDWAKLFQRLVQAVLFFHPAIWWVSRRLDLDREIACDNWVIARTGAPTRYARCLARLMEMTAFAPQPALASGAVTTNKQIFRRFESLLAQRGKTVSALSRRSLIMVATVLLAAGVMAPQLFPAVTISDGSLSYGDVTYIFASDAGTAAGPAQSAAVVVGASASPSARAYVVTPGDAGSGIVVPRAHGYQYGYVMGSPSAVSVGQIGSGLVIASHGDNGVSTYTWNDGRRKLKVRLEGDIQFNDDETDIVSLSPGGYFEIVDQRDRTHHVLEVEPDRDGNLDYTYYRDRIRRDFDDEGRAWLAKALPEILTITAINVDERVERIRRKEGVQGVIELTQMLDSDYTKRRYFEALLDSGPLTADELREVLSQVARKFESDFEKAELLITIADQADRKDFPTKAYLEAVRSLDSDFETRRSLSAVSLDGEADPAILAEAIRTAGELDSDFEKAELLISLSPEQLDDPEVNQAFVDALGSIQSDFEFRRVLQAQALNREVDDGFIEDVLRLTNRMSSDFEKAELLIFLDQRAAAGNRLALPYVEAIKGLHSDYDKRRVLETLELPDGDEVLLLRVLDIVDDISSDFDKAEYLQAVRSRYTANEKALDAYLRSLDGISSDYDRSRVLQSMVLANSLSNAAIMKVIHSTQGLSSDFEKAQVLQKLAQRCAEDKALRDYYLDAVEKISSEYERDQLYGDFYRAEKRVRE
jgi:beta-lactamase regulating signal transducer with metallopeptidase domain